MRDTSLFASTFISERKISGINILHFSRYIMRTAISIENSFEKKPYLRMIVFLPRHSILLICKNFFFIQVFFNPLHPQPLLIEGSILIVAFWIFSLQKHVNLFITSTTRLLSPFLPLPSQQHIGLFTVSPERSKDSVRSEILYLTI